MADWYYYMHLFENQTTSFPRVTQHYLLLLYDPAAKSFAQVLNLSRPNRIK